MPTYEYACAACGKRYETREGFDAPARQKCQVCGKGLAQRVLFAPPVVFKGSGFYKTDSRGSSDSSAPSTATAASSDDASKPAATDSRAKPTPAPASTDSSTTEAAAAG
ncbi:MAG: FmdB family transcriptional regulator [Chloroflexota bacterium]|nr:FmdB family transcriptional regulator [Chloroflexota bacterium]